MEDIDCSFKTTITWYYDLELDIFYVTIVKSSSYTYRRWWQLQSLFWITYTRLCNTIGSVMYHLNIVNLILIGIILFDVNLFHITIHLIQQTFNITFYSFILVTLI